MESRIPIFEKYRYDTIIGWATQTTKGLDVSFLESQEKTQDEIFQIFGTCTFHKIAVIPSINDGPYRYSRIIIVGWST